MRRAIFSSPNGVNGRKWVAVVVGEKHLHPEQELLYMSAYNYGKWD